MDVHARLEERTSAWRVAVERVVETETSILAFGRQRDRAVLLKLSKAGDEWRSGEILAAFDGRGVAQVYESAEGAILLERLTPATPLSILSRAGRDNEASAILSRVIASMASPAAVDDIASVEEWGAAFDGALASGHEGVPADLVIEAKRVYADLCSTQRQARLLHGDLHHDNVLFDDTRGWLAIDPKGVIGELEFELGAIFRNPYDLPQLFAQPSTIERRAERFARDLNLDRTRILAWAFAQAVLAVIWLGEDGSVTPPDHQWIRLANTLRAHP